MNNSLLYRIIFLLFLAGCIGVGYYLGVFPSGDASRKTFSSAPSARHGASDEGSQNPQGSGNPRGKHHFTPLSADAAAARPLNAPEAARVARQIASGHSYTKHGAADFHFTERQQLVDLLEKILKHPSDSRVLSNGRVAYWDDDSGTIIILNPHDPDGGTAFPPNRGKAYFNAQR